MIIYKATNIIDGKIYIGKTVQSLKRRKQSHLAHAKRGCTYYFHRAIRKHGAENFHWKVIHKSCPGFNLGALETFYIKKYREISNLYNLTDGGEGVPGKKCSPETRAKISKANKGQVPWIKGKKMTEEHKRKLSLSKRNPSEETRTKMRAASKGRNLGRKAPPEERLRRSISATGRKLTEEDRRKISESKIGKPISEAHKRKLSEITKKQFATKESRATHSIIMKEYYAKKKVENERLSG
jgi:group I intron endonuclease